MEVHPSENLIKLSKFFENISIFQIKKFNQNFELFQNNESWSNKNIKNKDLLTLISWLWDKLRIIK